MPQAAECRDISRCPVHRLLYRISSERPNRWDRNPSECDGGDRIHQREGRGSAHQSLREPGLNAPSKLPGGRKAGRIRLLILPLICRSMLTLHGAHRAARRGGLHHALLMWCGWARWELGGLFLPPGWGWVFWEPRGWRQSGAAPPSGVMGDGRTRRGRAGFLQVPVLQERLWAASPKHDIALCDSICHQRKGRIRSLGVSLLFSSCTYAVKSF